MMRLPMVRSCVSDSVAAEASPRSGRAWVAPAAGQISRRRTRVVRAITGEGAAASTATMAARPAGFGARTIMTEKLTHFDERGAARMVDVAAKAGDPSGRRGRGVASACGPRPSPWCARAPRRRATCWAWRASPAIQGRQAHRGAGPAVPSGAAHLGRRSSSRSTSRARASSAAHGGMHRAAPAWRWRRSPPCRWRSSRSTTCARRSIAA